MRKLIVMLFGAAAVGVAFAPGALAADMPAKAPMYTKAPALVADPWTGWYLGASAGGRWNKDTWTATGFISPPLPIILGGTTTRDFTTTSARFGLYGGYNWRIQQTWVVGLEGDFAWASNKNSSNTIPGLLFFGSSSDTVQIKDTWDGGIRARLGYLIAPNTLLFVTGGGSWMKTEASITCGPVAAVTTWCSGSNHGRTDSVSKTVAGWTAGGGLEAVVMPNWLLRGEYRYASYGSFHATLLQGGNGNLDVVEADIKNRTHTVLVGLAYKFGQ